MKGKKGCHQVKRSRYFFKRELSIAWVQSERDFMALFTKADADLDMFYAAVEIVRVQNCCWR